MGSLGLGVTLRVLSGLCILASVACAAIYPEIETPIGPPPNEDAVKPSPPDGYVCLYVKAARLPSQTRDGRKWSKGNGYPSTYAILSIDGEEVYRTEVEPNTLEPSWSSEKKANFKLVSKSRVKIEIWDDHGLFPHPICLREVLSVPNYVDLGEAELDCEGGAHVTLAVEPAHARWGLGFFFEVHNGGASVTRVIPASSAGRAGLESGDEILEVMGRPLPQLQVGEAQSLIRSNSTTGINLLVSTHGAAPRKVRLKDEAIYPLVRDHIPIQ